MKGSDRQQCVSGFLAQGVEQSECCDGKEEIQTQGCKKHF